MDDRLSELSNSSSDNHLERNVHNRTADIPSSDIDTTTGSLTAELRRPLATNYDGSSDESVQNVGNVSSNRTYVISDITFTSVLENRNISMREHDDTLLTISSLEMDNLHDSAELRSIAQGNQLQDHDVDDSDSDAVVESEEINESQQFPNDYDETYDSSDEEYLEENFNEDEENYFNEFTVLTDMLSKDDSNETVNANFVVNKAEILLAILKYAATYSLPNSAIADLCKMINTFLDVNIIPDTRYRIDKLFYPDEGKQYHAVCPTCKTYSGTFDKSKLTIFCNVCENNIDLKDPSYRDFFVTLDVRPEVKNIIENNDEYYMSVISKRHEHVTDWKDIHDGEKYKSFIDSLPENHKDSYASVTFNSDGSPAFKSSKFSVWPIHIMLNEVPVHVRNENTIVYALWFGHDKPDMLYFLRVFVMNMNDLSQNGIKCKINNVMKNIYLYPICCCVDSVARAPMQGITQFNGYYGCNWCLQKGKSVTHDTGRAVKYTLEGEIARRRTAEQTLQQMQSVVESGVPIFGVRKATPLINLLHFDIIDGFVPDPMHCIDLGIVKQFTEYWLTSLNKPYSIPKHYIDTIDQQIKSLRVPTQLMRLSRTIKDRKYWKAKEWSNWLLYYSLPIVQQFSFFETYAKHWSLLIEAYHLLLQDTITELSLRTANFLLKEFVILTEHYYGEDAMTYNIHQLVHIPQSVADWGPLWAHFEYPFESGNGKLVRNIHAAKGVLSQVCRNVSFNRSLLLLEAHVALKEYSPVLDYCNYLQNRLTNRTVRFDSLRYFGKPVKVNQTILRRFNLSTNHTRAYKKLVKNKCSFTTCNKNLYRSNNSFALTKNSDFIVIEQFIVDVHNNIHLTVCRKIQVVNAVNGTNSIKKIEQISQDIEAVETKQLEKLCVFMDVDSKEFIAAVPNMYWL